MHSGEINIPGSLLTSHSYDPFGQVIQTKESTSIFANQGTANRTNNVANIVNLRADAKPNMCTFRCKPREIPFDVKVASIFLMKFMIILLYYILVLN